MGFYLYQVLLLVWVWPYITVNVWK